MRASIYSSRLRGNEGMGENEGKVGGYPVKLGMTGERLVAVIWAGHDLPLRNNAERKKE